MKSGQILKRIREDNKLKLMDFAIATELSIGYISDIEHGRRNPLHEVYITIIENNLNIDLSEYTKKINRESIDKLMAEILAKANTPEGKEDLQKAFASSRKMIDLIQKSREIDPKSLREPFTI